MPVITIAGNDGISVEKKREMVKKYLRLLQKLMTCQLMQ